MRKTVLTLAALAVFICHAEPDDMATEAYAHFEATNEVAKAKAQIDASIGTKSAQDRAYASSVASNALATAKSYAEGLVVDVDSDSIISNAVETTIMIVDGRGYLLPSSTNGLAKTSYVDAKVMEQIDIWKAELGTTNYAQKSWVLSLDYTTLGAVQSYLAQIGYATKGYVSDNYVSKEQLNAADYAQKAWVDSYVAEHMPSIMPARLSMSIPEDSDYVEPVAIFGYYIFVFDDKPGNPRVIFHNGGFRIDCEYGEAVGDIDDFDGTVSFYLQDAPFERYVFRYKTSPVATIDKVDQTALALAGQVPTTVSNIVTKAYVENLGITSEEIDPTVPQWAKAPTKPAYTASEVGATSPTAVSNIVTTAYVREKLGVYLYVGEDGGIYVHTNEE